MRDRHFPRLCRSCDVPMARQEDTCWSCEAAWDYRSARRDGRRVTPGGRAARPDDGDQPPAPAVIGVARAVAQARLAVHRLADDGGSLADEGSRRIGAQIGAVK
ncbi:MAG TPA: hypothetical protein VJU80_01260 [Solirubrobacteraceae bacterium]|nr:hypothetical protein [Solirubrobacteraceae bacterium]